MIDGIAKFHPVRPSFWTDGGRPEYFLRGSHPQYLLMYGKLTSNQNYFESFLIGDKYTLLHTVVCFIGLGQSRYELLRVPFVNIEVTQTLEKQPQSV
jgi:hypothetical protein